MYDVTIRKLVRLADGSSVVYEDPAQVNHERHAENLAAKIARDPGVQWVEVEEARGRFKARASLGRDGTVHESLGTKGHTARLKRRSPRRKRRRAGYLWVILAIIVLGLLRLLFTGK